MAQIVYVYGKSGAGKSRSLKNFAEDEILLIKCMDKELPFRSKFKYTGKTVNVDAILGQLKKMSELNIKTAVIDDEAKALSYLKANHPELVKVEESYKKSDIKKLIDDGNKFDFAHIQDNRKGNLK